MPVAGIALAAAFIVALVILYRRDRTATRTRRRGLFDECLTLVDHAVLTQDDVAWPVLTGAYRNREVRIEPVVDQVVFRQVPSLWLVVSIRQKLPLAGTFDLLARRRNVEFYSPATELPRGLPLPDGWPDHTTLKSDREAAELPLDALTPHVNALFAEPRAKELVVTPRGVRIVHQLQGADRGEYRVLRSATFHDARVGAALLESLLERATAICADLMPEDSHANA